MPIDINSAHCPWFLALYGAEFVVSFSSLSQFVNFLK